MMCRRMLRPVGQPVVAHGLPDVLDRVEFGALGGQCGDSDVGGHLELAGRVPSGLIHQDDGMGTRRYGEGYFSRCSAMVSVLQKDRTNPAPCQVLGRLHRRCRPILSAGPSAPKAVSRASPNAA